ncbi:hypothetical protein JVW19_22645, partial [Vibrio cholerae O1]|nr:hypothetical protein [Vibrio cholerae O1]
EILTVIRETKKLEDDVREQLEKALKEFNENWVADENQGSRAGTEDSSVASSDEVEQEQIVRQKR